MNAIRSLPLMNRPSRTSTPGPNVPVSGSAAVQPLGPPPVPEPRARHPLAHVVAPAPVPAARSQSVGSKRVPSPPTSRAATPRHSGTPLPPSGTETPHGGYMDAIGLRLNETVNKACAGVDFKSKKGFRKGTGWTVGDGVTHELPPPTADTYLLRAILRTAVRSLSIYVGRLDALLLPALSDAQFAQALNLTPGAHGAVLNTTQAFAVSVAHAAWETCERLEQMLETSNYPRFVEDTLRPTMDKLDLVVGKVVRPMLVAIKHELEDSITNTHGVTHKAPAGPATVPAPNAPPVPLTREKSNPPGTRLTKEASGGGYPRTLAVPSCLQQFASRVDGARKVFESVFAPCGHDGEGWMAKVVVALIWRGMRVISENDGLSSGNRTPSPNSVSKALAGLGKEATPTVVASPSLAKITSLSLLPSRTQSRPPSPPRHNQRYDPATHALMSFEGLVKRLVGGLVQPPTAAPTATDVADVEAEHIAREALDEAIEALESAAIASATAHGEDGAARILASVRRLRDDIDDRANDKLDDALEDLPSVSLFGVILRCANAALAALPASDPATGAPLRVREPAEVWGWAPAEYERQVVSGFGPAEEWGPRVARALKPEVERVLTALAAEAKLSNNSKETLEAADWVRALGVALDARAGVKVPRAV